MTLRYLCDFSIEDVAGSLGVSTGVIVDVDYGDGSSDRSATPYPVMTGAECWDARTNLPLQGYGPWTPPNSVATTLTFTHTSQGATTAPTTIPAG